MTIVRWYDSISIYKWDRESSGDVIRVPLALMSEYIYTHNLINKIISLQSVLFSPGEMLE